MCDMINSLCCICNHPSLVSHDSLTTHTRGVALPQSALLDKTPLRHTQNLLAYHPFKHIHLDSLNLVFLKQELTTTGKLFGKKSVVKKSTL